MVSVNDRRQLSTSQRDTRDAKLGLSERKP
jgi:hypothetical protein